MAKSKLTSKATRLTVAKRLHPEDISVGDHVAISHISYQCPTFMWCGIDTATLPIEQPVRITLLPADEHLPMIVKSLCVPFILCELQNGTSQVYDLRQIQLVLVDARFFRLVKIAVQDRDKNRKKKKKRKKKGKTRK